jgi:hypothetical protein
MAPAMEVYSIDESFLDLTGISGTRVLGIEVRSRVRAWTGLTVCVGMRSTKTRAKLANHIAKKLPVHGGAFYRPCGAVWAAPDLLIRVRLQEGRYPAGEIAPKLNRQVTLFGDTEELERRSRLNSTLDRLKLKFGRGTLLVAAARTEKRWSMRRQNL